MNLKTFQQSELKEFNDRRLGCCGGDGCPYYDYDAGNHNEALEKFFSSSIEKAFALGKEEARKFILNEWEVKIDEVKDNLDEQYGEGHNYYPNYEGIFEDILEKMRGGMENEK